MMTLSLWKEILVICLFAVQVGADNRCGVTFTNRFGDLSSSGVGNYSNGVTCDNAIKSSYGNRIVLTFRMFEVEKSPNCIKDGLEIWEGGTLKERRCGTDKSPYVSTTNRIRIRFITDDSITMAGYHIQYEICGGLYEELYKMNIQSPLFGISQYPNNTLCNYRINSMHGFGLRLIFKHFLLENSTQCTNDNFTVYNGSSNLISNKCGNNRDDVIVSSTSLIANFRTNAFISDAGYSIDVYACSKVFRSDRGVISSPIEDNLCPSKAACIFEIQLDPGSKIKLTFTSLSLLSDESLTIKNGSRVSGDIPRNVSSIASENLLEYGNAVFLNLSCSSSFFNRGRGFSLQYYDNQGACSRYKPCKNGAPCVDINKEQQTYNCICPVDYEGKNCDQKKAPCKSNPCLNGGTCSDVYRAGLEPTYACHCTEEYRGETCQHFIDGCREYKEDSRWQRSVSNTDKTSSFCDNSLTFSWYRFVSPAGFDMPTECPADNSCGTKGSIWINSTFPFPTSNGNETDVTACVRNSTSCCSNFWKIRVKTCIELNGTSYNVYRLRSTPSCPMAYCAGTEWLCPTDYSSVNGFTPGCTETHPKIISKPTIYYNVTNNRLQFNCEFQSNATNETAMFEVTWYEGSPYRKINQTDILNGTQRLATLQNSHNFTTRKQLFRLGTTFYCRVTSWYAERPYGIIKGPTIESNHFFAGFKVLPSHHHYLRESDAPLKLSVTNTVPINCSSSTECTLRIKISQDGIDLFVSLCLMHFKNGPVGQIRDFEVVAKRDFLDDGNKRVVLSFDVLNGSDAIDWNHHHKIPDVVITVIDVPTGYCTSSTDPRIYTFEGSSYFQTKVGDFVLVKSTKRDFEIHARTYQCGFGISGTCNCGIAARENNDVIVVDFCPGGPMVAWYASKRQPADGTRLERYHGRKYQIHLHSGASVLLDGTSITVKLPSDDYGTTIGGCHGPLHWIPNGSHLFSYQDKTEICQNETKKLYCICTYGNNDEAAADCEYKSVIDRQEFAANTKGRTILLPPIAKKCKIIEDGNIIILPEPEKPQKPRNWTQWNDTEPTWPTRSGKTEEVAKNYCNDMIRNSDVAKACKTILGSTIQSYIDACVRNVLLTDSYSFTLQVIQSMQTVCGEEILKNITNPDFENTLCPGLCSGHGKCVNATCICDANFTSVDCSIDRNKGPSLTSIRFGSVCDVRATEDCHIVRIIGNDFLEAAGSRCRTTKLKLTSTGYKGTSEQGLHKSEMLSFAEVICSLNGHPVHPIKGVRKHGAYMIDVTNDGVFFSRNQLKYVIYDSQCMHCNPNSQMPTVCNIKKNMCSIGGFCYNGGDASPSDRFLICNPSSSQIEFTKDHFPNINSSPVISPFVRMKRLAFKCEFESNTNDTAARFEVTWYEGSKKINQTDILRGLQRNATLQNNNSSTEKQLFSLGTIIFCRVRSWYENATVGNISGPSLESNHYFAGIKVEPRKQAHVISESGNPLELRIITTVPIVCLVGDSCQVVVKLETNGSDCVLSTCEVHFRPGEGSKIVEVKAKRDFIIDGDKKIALSLEITKTAGPVDWNNHHKIPDVIINVKDVDTRRCQSIGDPHVLTFDRLYFNHYKVGTYILTKSKCRNFEVHVRTHECSTVSCNCGIAAREGNDVIVIDFCREKIPTARFASKGTPANGTKLLRDATGKNFLITFPSGSFVKFNTFPFAGSYYSNINIQIPSDDFNCTVGLCGTFDEKLSNEMRNRNGKIYPTMEGAQAPSGFTESWRLAADKSLFHYTDKTEELPSSKMFCSCPSASSGLPRAVCSSDSNQGRSSYVKHFEGWLELVSPHDKRIRTDGGQKRIILPATDDGVKYDFEPKQPSGDVPTWPTKSGRTEMEVKTKCSDAIRNSTAGKACSIIPNFPFHFYERQCLEDIQITDTEEFTLSAIQAMEMYCEEVFLKNDSYWRRNITTNETVYPETDPRKHCPSWCSGKGQCVNSKCVCEYPYILPDCSMDEKKQPTIHSVGDGGLCDARKRSDCHLVRVRGIDFRASEKLTCKITKITDTGNKDMENTAKHEALLITFKEVQCDIRSNTLKRMGVFNLNSDIALSDSYTIEISNDGMEFSRAPHPYVIYDSKCMDCDGFICKQKDKTCIINGNCYNHGESGDGQKCDSKEKFKPGPVTGKMMFDKERDVAIIVLGCFVGIVLIAVIASLVGIRRKKKEDEAKSKIEKEFEETLELGRIDLSLFFENEDGFDEKEDEAVNHEEETRVDVAVELHADVDIEDKCKSSQENEIDTDDTPPCEADIAEEVAADISCEDDVMIKEAEIIVQINPVHAEGAGTAMKEMVSFKMLRNDEEGDSLDGRNFNGVIENQGSELIDPKIDSESCSVDESCSAEKIKTDGEIDQDCQDEDRSEESKSTYTNKSQLNDDDRSDIGGESIYVNAESEDLNSKSEPLYANALHNADMCKLDCEKEAIYANTGDNRKPQLENPFGESELCHSNVSQMHQLVLPGDIEPYYSNAADNLGYYEAGSCYENVNQAAESKRVGEDKEFYYSNAAGNPAYEEN